MWRRSNTQIARSPAPRLPIQFGKYETPAALRVRSLLRRGRLCDVRIRPREARGARAHIGRKADEVFTIDPLEYRLRTVDNRLVIRIYNPTEEPIGAARRGAELRRRSERPKPPAASQTIAPASFIKLILPPIPPRLEPYGPTFGVGVGMHVSDDRHARHHHHHYHDPFPYDDRPRYYTLYDEGNEFVLGLGRRIRRPRHARLPPHEEKTFRHEFVFHRKKM